MAPVAETQASLFVALDQTFAAFARVSRPYIQETISKSPSTLDAANADLPVLRPFCTIRQRFFTAFQPGAAALAKNLADDRRRRARRRPGPQRLPTLNAQLVPTAEALLAFQNAPGVFNGLDLLIDTNNTPRPGDRVHRPGADHLQLPDPRLQEPRQRRPAKRNGLGNWLDFISSSHRKGPTAEGAPASAPANGPAVRKPPPLQPVPEHRIAGPALYLRSGQRSLSGRTDRDRQSSPASTGPRPPAS